MADDSLLWTHEPVRSCFLWPKESRVLPDTANQWSVPVFEDGMTDEFAVSLYVTDANADRRIRDWLDAGQRTG